jgi:hypothetical protein
MRRIIKILLPAVLLLSLACKKSLYTNATPTAGLNVINAAADVPNLNVNFTTNPIPYYQYQQPIVYGSSWEWGRPPGDSPISLVSSLDTTKAFYSGYFNLKADSTYSLYLLSGAAKGDLIFMRDSIPIYSDSTAGIRFINLSPDSGPVTINLQGNNPAQTEFPALVYKQISPFKGYSAGSQTGGAYNFEIRSSTTQSVLANFSWSFRFQRCHTVVMAGSVDPLSATPFNAFAVNNF